MVFKDKPGGGIEEMWDGVEHKASALNGRRFEMRALSVGRYRVVAEAWPELAIAPVEVTAKGTAHPLGATPDKSGVNFSIFSSHATSVELLLFQNHDDAAPFQVIEFDPYINKTFHFWHVFVEGLPSGTHYAFRIDGPSSVEAGHRFNRNKVLIDPGPQDPDIFRRQRAGGRHLQPGVGARQPDD